MMLFRSSSIITFLTLVIKLGFCLLPQKDYKPNVFVISDISNEPDDAESLVRLLLYTNELSLKGIVATTSYWLNDTTHEEDIYPIIDGYEKVHSSLLKHSTDYPTADYLRSIIASGHPVYGLKSLEQKKISKGAANLIKAVDNTPKDESLFVLLWGGAAVLAEALNEVSNKRKAKAVDEFTSKLHVYAISDQDDSGPWIRGKFPQIPYIASVHGYNQYGLSTWVGISGEVYNSFDQGGPQTELVSKGWLKKNIQDVSPLGATYLEYMFNLEGDTPSTLAMIPNGLNYPPHPEYGGWGGRYTLSDLSGRSRHFADAADYVVGANNETFVSNKATIWRWRDAYQYDFAARMQWTVKGFDETGHAPVVVANGSDSVKPFELSAPTESNVTLDASGTYDLNDNALTFKWFHYYDISLSQGNRIEVPEIEIRPKNDAGSIVEFTVPSDRQACCNVWGKPVENCKVYHIILEVTNAAEIPMKAYKRFVIFPERSEVAEASSEDHDEL